MLTLIEKIPSGSGRDTLTLSFELRQKSRQRVQLDSGTDAAIVLAPGTTLADGDVLRAADGTTVRVQAARETVTTARSDDAHLLARACYHLGNRHVRVQIGSGWVRYQPDHVLDDMVRGLGLTVALHSACFEPERGAYGGSARHHHHDHDIAPGAPAAPHGHDH